MEIGLRKRISRWLINALMKEEPSDPFSTPLYDFQRLCYELRPGDVLLNEGRSHVSDVIKMATQSPWTHSMLYIGRLYDIENTEARDKVKANYAGDPNEQLIIEALLGEGTIVSPLQKYHDEHIRICRPKNLSPHDAQQVIAYAINQIGLDYDVRQILDLLRFMFPYSFLPRRWRSSLFAKNAGNPTRTVCSTMIAEAFHAVKFPILPFAEKTENGKIRLFQRNPRLYTPKDFDYSPYFDIIKYPFFGLDDVSIYKRLPWENEEVYCNNLNDCYAKASHEPVKITNNNEFPEYKTVDMNISAEKKPATKQPAGRSDRRTNKQPI